jgi:hypothetical protein
MLNKLATYFTILMLIVLTTSLANAFQNEPTGWYGNKWSTDRGDLKNIPKIQPASEEEAKVFNVIPNVRIDVYQVINNNTLYVAFTHDKLTAIFKRHTVTELEESLKNLIQLYGKPTSIMPGLDGGSALVGWKGETTVVSLVASRITNDVLVSYISSKIMEQVTSMPPEKKREEGGQPSWNDPRYYGHGRRVAKVGVIMPMY